jgi:hypothetical protein
VQLVSPFSYTKLQILNNSSTGFSSTFDNISTDYWLLFLNYGNNTCMIKSSLKQDSKQY